MRQGVKSYWQRSSGPSQWGWALLLLVVLTAAGFRFWQLGQLPPGLYRDEAFNGLDALEVLDGQHALYFPANNGREPIYIYLTALFISLVGRSALSVRMGAAVIGTLTTWITYQTASAWFNRRVGLAAAWLWGITFWPVHLSRIGLRPVLMPLFLSATFWLGTLAYRRQKSLLWLISGLVYGLGFYTYLAMRFTPLLLLLFATYLVLTGRLRRIGKGFLWFGLGAVSILLPLAAFMIRQPEYLLGRSGQVSIFNANINGGDFWGTLWANLIRGLGLFLWRGDTILRHNPAGRPVFDLFMALPFLAGLIWCAFRWRRPPAVLLMLWSGVMLGPTILAEDTPHFLRAVGLLPAIIIFPAIGLINFWQWQRLPKLVRQLLVSVLLVASAARTLIDYVNYSNQPDVAYLFEAAATDLAGQILDEPPQTAVFLDERFWEGWPSVPFIVGARPVARFRPEVGIPLQKELPVSIYAWPYGPLDYVPKSLPTSALVSAKDGSLARGDLDDVAAVLYIRYAAQSRPRQDQLLANFGDQLQLEKASKSMVGDRSIKVDLYWSAEATVTQQLVVFVHVTTADGTILAQDDAPVASGRWPRQWWRPGLLLDDSHLVTMPTPYNPDRHRLQIGVYDAQTRVRLPVVNSAGEIVADAWLLEN